VATHPPPPGSAHSLPPAAPYPLPTEDELPANRAPWQPRASRSVLLIHDMQNYFLNAFAPGAAPLPRVLDHIAELRRACAVRGVPVVYTAQPGGQDPADRGLLSDFWGPGLGRDPRAGAIVDALAPGPDDRVLTKWRYSAFVRTDLADLLDAWGRDQVLVTGVYAHIGVLATACDAFMRDVQAFLVADAVADFSAAHHRRALDYAAARCAVTLSTRAVLDQLDQPIRLDPPDQESGSSAPPP
jgi:bifunctional isochorismate lyase / aryl carrier protein